MLHAAKQFFIASRENISTAINEDFVDRRSGRFSVLKTLLYCLKIISEGSKMIWEGQWVLLPVWGLYKVTSLLKARTEMIPYCKNGLPISGPHRREI